MEQEEAKVAEDTGSLEEITEAVVAVHMDLEQDQQVLVVKVDI